MNYESFWTTSQAHSSVERAGLIGGVLMRKVPTDNNYSLRGDILQKMMKEDKAAGLIPFYVRKTYCLKKKKKTHIEIMRLMPIWLLMKLKLYLVYSFGGYQII